MQNFTPEVEEGYSESRDREDLEDDFEKIEPCGMEQKGNGQMWYRGFRR
jgi:hypothetical protein